MSAPDTTAGFEEVVLGTGEGDSVILSAQERKLRGKMAGMMSWTTKSRNINIWCAKSDRSIIATRSSVLRKILRQSLGSTERAMVD